MVRIAASAVVNLIANAIALLACWVLPLEVDLSIDGFVIAVVLYTVISTLVEPLVRQVAVKNAPAILGSSALVATLLSLIITSILSDSLQITGLATWVLATVIVWVIALIARLTLPFIVFKRVLRGASAGSNS